MRPTAIFKLKHRGLFYKPDHVVLQVGVIFQPCVTQTSVPELSHVQYVNIYKMQCILRYLLMCYL